LGNIEGGSKVRKLFLIAMLLLGSILIGPRQSSSVAGQEQSGAAAGATAPESVIKVTITTGGGLHGPVKSRYKVGEEIPVAISMTNRGSAPVKFCLSTAVFQNRPQLKRDGKLLPYATNLTKMAGEEEFIKRCEMSGDKRYIELQPKQTRLVDWLTFNSTSINWFGALEAGHYELVLERRLACCQGPMVESDKIAFEIVP
jgi:hypothetical protein